MEQVTGEKLRMLLDQLEGITVSKRPIGADGKTERADESYPLRFHLRQLSRYVWSDLMKQRGREPDILRAVDIVRHEFESYFSAAHEVEEYQELQRSVQCGPAGVLAEHFQARRENRRFAMASETDARSSPFRKWYLQSDPSVGLELIETEWLERKELWHVESDWTWADVHDFLTLLTIDSAMRHIEEEQPFKAAVAAARASEYHGVATAIRWSDAVGAAAISSLGRRGADVRHGPNRAARDEAIQLYLSKRWSSLAQAARSIATQVHRTERVVEKWLREHKKGTSSGTVPI